LQEANVVHGAPLHSTVRACGLKELKQLKGSDFGLSMSALENVFNNFFDLGFRRKPTDTAFKAGLPTPLSI
jgi:hypothetical protein